MRTLMAIPAQWHAQKLLVLFDVVGIAWAMGAADTARHILDLGDVALFGGGELVVHADTSTANWMRSPIQRTFGTAQLLPSALYLGPSGHSLAGFLRHGISV